jgi:hypothetical protein
MNNLKQTIINRVIPAALLLALGLIGGLTTISSSAANNHVSKPFAGVKVNGGTVMHSKMGGKHVLTLSDDFKVPDTPDPHWQIVDSKGTVHLLHRLGIKGDKVNKSVTLPPYIHDVATVQIWCAWAETLLGEASFDTPQK